MFFARRLFTRSLVLRRSTLPHALFSICDSIISSKPHSEKSSDQGCICLSIVGSGDEDYRLKERGGIFACHPHPINRLPAFVATAAATTATGAAIGLRACFVDVQRSAIQFSAIQFGDGAIRIRVGAHLDESEPSGLAGIPVSDDVYAFHGSISLEHGSNGIFGSPKIEVPYKNILHFSFSFWLTIRESGQDRTRAVWTGRMRRCQITTNYGFSVPRNLSGSLG